MLRAVNGKNPVSITFLLSKASHDQVFQMDCWWFRLSLSVVGPVTWSNNWLFTPTPSNFNIRVLDNLRFCPYPDTDIFPGSDHYLWHVASYSAINVCCNTNHRVLIIRCDQCGESFARLDNLLRHSARHKHGKIFDCATCGKGFHRKVRYIVFIKYCMSCKYVDIFSHLSGPRIM